MEDCVRPNIAVPVSLWGEVKVSAFRRGMKPCDVVLEILREKFDDGYRKEKGFPSKASVQRLREKVEALGGSDVGSPAKSPPAPIPVSAKAPVDQKVISAYLSGGIQATNSVSSIPAYPDEVMSARHKCEVCHLSFHETEMTYHAKTLRWACNECVEKQG